VQPGRGVCARAAMVWEGLRLGRGAFPCEEKERREMLWAGLRSFPCDGHKGKRWRAGGDGRGVQAGDVIYTDVDRQGGGIVEFANKADQVALRARAPFDHCFGQDPA
jgi:hypothetical protein